MKPSRFSITQTLKYALYASVEHFFFFFTVLCTWSFTMIVSLGVLGAALLYPVKETIFMLFTRVDQMDRAEFTQTVFDMLVRELGIVALIFVACIILLYSFLQFGLIRIGFDVHDKGTSLIGRLFSEWRVLLKGIAVNILYGILVLGGLFLFVVPGIIAAVTYGFAIYVLIDKNCGIFEAFKESARLTYGSRKHIFGLIFMLLVIKQVSLGMFALGYIILWPVSLLALVHLYRKLQTTASV